MEKLFNIVKKGYDQSEVDKYIETLETMIKGYKEKDDSIKNAIINAQVAADNIIKNAEMEAEKIKFRAIKALNEIQTSVAAQKLIVKNFQEEYNRLTNKYLHSIGNDEISNVFSKVSELEEFIENVNRANDTTGMFNTITRTESLPRDVVFGAESKADKQKEALHSLPPKPPLIVPAPPTPKQPEPLNTKHEEVPIQSALIKEPPKGKETEQIKAVTKEPAEKPTIELPSTKETAAFGHNPLEENGRKELMNDLFGPPRGDTHDEGLGTLEQGKKKKR